MKLLGGLIDIVQEIHKMMSSADMRSRLAFGNAVEANEKMEKLVEKNKKDFEFLMNSPKQLSKFYKNVEPFMLIKHKKDNMKSTITYNSIIFKRVNENK